MATATSSPGTARLFPLKQTAGSLGRGLIWACLMLVLLTVWLSRKHESLPFWVPILTMLAAGLSLGLAGLLLLPQRVSTGEEDKQADLVAYRLGLALPVLTIGSAVLFVLGIYLLATFGLAAFGEGVGLLLFAAVGLLAARSHTAAPARPEDQPWLDWLRERPGNLGMVLLGLSGACLLVFVWLVFFKSIDLGGFPGWPEAFALPLLTLLFTGGAVYLMGSTEEERSRAALRILILVLGGLTGLLLFLMVLGRIWLWRDTILLGGLTVWQGDDGWRVWYCAYLGLFALGLMFVSVLLAQPDIRSSSTLRRVLFGYNALVTALLVLVILGVVNIVSYTLFPYQFDWSRERGLQALSTGTKNLLDNLKRKTTAYLILPGQKGEYRTLYTMLDNFKSHTDKFDYKHVNPFSAPGEFESIVKNFQDILDAQGRLKKGYGILLVYGDLDSKQKQHAYIAEDAIYANELETPNDPRSKRKRVFKGEVELMKQLNFFVAETKSKVYVLQGQGELELASMEPLTRAPQFHIAVERLGMGQLRNYLTDLSFELKGLNFGSRPPGDKSEDVVFLQDGDKKDKLDVPADSDLLLVLGPSRPFSPEVLAALERYIERGGKMIATFDIVAKDRELSGLKTTGLEGLLKKYGVDVGEDFIISANPLNNPVYAIAEVPKRANNELADLFVDTEVLMETVRPVRPNRSVPRFSVDVVLQVPSETLVFTETALPVLGNPRRFLFDLDKRRQLRDRLSRDPIPVGVAVGEFGKKPQLVVFGDTEFLCNLDLTKSPTAETNKAWISSALNVMADRPGLKGPQPRESPNYYFPTNVDANWLRYLPGWLMLLAIVGLGGGLWIVRRR